MATKIEVLEVGPTHVRVALYYPVKAASQLTSAADQNRVPAGSRLTAGELADLKNGVLAELVKNIRIDGLAKAEVKSYIEGFWAKHRAEAEKDYDLKYRNASFVGKAFDGTAWS